jgi:predicted phosphodiesterase
MALSDRARELAAAESTATQAQPAPPGWRPGVEWDGTSGTLTTALLPAPPTHWNELLAVWDLDPAVFEVVEPVQYRAWDGPVAGGGVQRMFYYRATIRRRRAGLDVDELVKAVGRRKPRPIPVAVTDLPWFLVATADTQLGDGETSAVIDRFQAKTLAAVARFKALAKAGRCSRDVVLPWLGDCIQGTVTSAPILKNDLSIVEMLRVYRRLALWQVQQFMNHARVTMVAIPGNHDTPLRHGKTPAYDADQSWAVEGILQVADALRLAGRDDVRFIYPEPDRSTVTLDVAGTVVAFAHGHQWQGPASKIHAWWAGQSHGRTSPGAADLLLTGHRHHFYAEVAGGNRLAVVCPPLVSSSGYWTEARGDDTAPGLVTMLVGQGSWSGLEIL